MINYCLASLVVVLLAVACSPREATITKGETVTPKLEKRCPLQSLTSLANLGIPESSHLLAVPEDDESETEWMLIAKDGTPRKLLTENGNYEKVRSGFAGIDPQQGWFAFYAMSPESVGLDIWIASMNGQEQRQVMPGLPNQYSLEWLNEEMIMLYDQQRDDPWRTTSKRLNPISGEIETVQPIYLDSGIYTFSPDGSQVIYAEGFPQTWQIFDFSSNQKRKILPWLESEPAPGPNRAFVKWTDAGVSAALLTPTTMEVAINLPSNVLSQDNAPHVVVAFAEASTAHFIEWWSTDSRLIGLRRAFGENSGIPTSPEKYYVFDTGTLSLIEYCLRDEAIPDTVFASVDNAFLAWNVIVDNRKEIVVLDIATGRTALIPGFRTLGWGELVAEPSP